MIYHSGSYYEQVIMLIKNKFKNHKELNPEVLMIHLQSNGSLTSMDNTLNLEKGGKRRIG
jgi:hypothetical protein